MTTLAAILALSNTRPCEAWPADLSFVGSEHPALAAIFSAHVAEIWAAISPSFSARLFIYGVTPRLPSGIPSERLSSGRG